MDFFKKLTLFNYGESDLTLVKCFRHSKPRHWRSVGFATVATIFMSVVPAVSAAIVLSLASFDYRWTDFFKNGEVAVYCVGLLSAAILLTAKELKSPFAHRQFFSFLGVAGVILAMASYSGLCVAGAQNQIAAGTGSGKLTFALALSLVLYVYTICLSSVVTFVDEVREDLPENLADEAREAMRSNEGLREQFHELEVLRGF